MQAQLQRARSSRRRQDKTMQMKAEHQDKKVIISTNEDIE